MNIFTSRFLMAIRLLAILPLCVAGTLRAQEAQTTPDELKKLSLEQLMDMEVTTASKRSEKLGEVASAVQVITREDIIRSGATSIPEALRLVQNLQIAQFNSFGWLVSARGFNNVFSNKLLVMIDGRTVYNPLFAGVYWDVQSVLIEDIDRIEVISGPGGTLWGANAVNGIINIITKSASDTQGLYASAAGGSYLNGFGAVRYGGKIGDRVSYRVFAQHFDRDHTGLPDGANNRDKWKYSQAGMQMDWSDGDNDDVSFQANFYLGEERTNEGLAGQVPSTVDGQNAILKWTHVQSEKSDFILQGYFDRTWRRDPPSTINDQLTTFDVDFQHHLVAGSRNNIVWGVGARRMDNKTQHGTIFVGFLPENRIMPLFSGFIQDELTIVPERFKFTVGTKLLHNVYTKFEVQPSARIAFTPNKSNTIWSSVSRAVRTPSRIDVDYFLPAFEVPPPAPSVAGGPNFVSEKVVAYELGYRVQPASSLSVSLSGFFNTYHDLYSVEPEPGTLTFHIQNGTEGESYGTELDFIASPLDWWKLRGGYTYFHKNIWDKPGHTFDPTYAGTDPTHQFLVQSMMNLPANITLDLVGRYVGGLPASTVASLPAVQSYYEANVRVAWKHEFAELAVTGQNILSEWHSEYGTATPQGQNRIPRNIFVQATIRLD